MGATVSRNDYEWTYTEEPHNTRRKTMLKKYPQMKQLFAQDKHFIYVVLAIVAIQIIACYFVKDMSWLSIGILAYVFGGTLNHSLTLAVHEMAHNPAFGYSRTSLSQYFGMIANLPIAVPMTISFKKYHLDHHRYLGDTKMDVDIPMKLEGMMFRNSFLKVIWLVLNPIFYTMRPFFINPKPVSTLEIHNLIVQLTFNGCLMYLWGIKPLVYLFGGTLLALGLHPSAGHFISEHYMYTEGFETYSYYGSLNRLTFNVGYHMEHHDFPNIPGSKLPLVKKIAPDFYENLPFYTSWCKVLWDFAFKPAIGPFSRIRRNISENGASLSRKAE